MAYRLQVDGCGVEAQLVALRPRLSVRLGTVLHDVCAADAGFATGEFTLTVDGVAHQGWRCTLGDEVYVRLQGRTFAVRFVRHEPKSAGAAAQDHIRASMPGAVVAVHCEAGQAVQAGDKLLTLESMKLQMTIVSAHPAVVQQVHVVAAAVFERGALLVSLLPGESRET